MANPYLGEIKMVGFNFAPVGWAFTNGQLLAISQNNALFALLGTTYGGNGQTTFALPNLQSRMPMHMGQGVWSFVIAHDRSDRWRGNGHLSAGLRFHPRRSRPSRRWPLPVLAGRIDFTIPGGQLHHRFARYLSVEELKTSKPREGSSIGATTAEVGPRP